MLGTFERIRRKGTIIFFVPVSLKELNGFSIFFIEPRSSILLFKEQTFLCFGGEKMHKAKKLEDYFLAIC